MKTIFPDKYLLSAAMFFAVAVWLLSVADNGDCAELHSQYASIVYDSDTQLLEFNRNLSMENLSYLLKGRPSLTVVQEVGNKVDVIAERVQEILEMYIEELEFKIIVLPTGKDVQKKHHLRHGRKVLYIAFYSPGDNTIFISVKDTSLKVLTHEIAHVILSHYFKVPPSAKVHEVLAQFAEENIGK